MNPVRIALISHEYPPHWLGGIGNYTRQAAGMLLRRGHEVEVFAACPDRSYDENVEDVEVHYGRCGDRWKFGAVAAEMFARRHAMQPFDVVEAPELASEGREIFTRFPDVPSVVRLHTPAYLAAWVDRAAFGRTAVLLQALRYGAAEVVRGRRPQNGIGFWRSYSSLETSYVPETDSERSTALMADVLVSPSAALAGDVTRDWRLPRESVDVVPNPFIPDREILAVEEARRDVRTVVFFGGIRTYKGVDVLARAIPRILQRHPSVKFVFAGSSQRSPFPNFTRAGILQGNICSWEDMGTWLKKELEPSCKAVEFRGALDRSGVTRLLDESDLCVFPSRYDNFPNACLEAMAAARPIVATRSGGMAEMLDPVQAGKLVPPGKVEDLAQAICWMIENPDERRKMALRARGRVLGAYGDDALGPAYEQLYNKAIMTAGNPSSGVGGAP